MMKLDPTLKHLGTVLRRRLPEAPGAAETPNRIAELLEQLARAGENDRSNDAPNPSRLKSRPSAPLASLAGVSRKALL